MATAVGMEERVDEVIAELEKTYKKARERLQSEKGIDFDYIEVIDYSTNDTISLYLYSDTSIQSGSSCFSRDGG